MSTVVLTWSDNLPLEDYARNIQGALPLRRVCYVFGPQELHDRLSFLSSCQIATESEQQLSFYGHGAGSEPGRRNLALEVGHVLIA